MLSDRWRRAWVSLSTPTAAETAAWVSGRSSVVPAAALRLKSRAVSNEHAVLFWDEGWHLRDLGSRNGTWVDDVRLSPGTSRRLERGAMLRFGERAQTWRLVDAREPTAIATRHRRAVAHVAVRPVCGGATSDHQQATGGVEGGAQHLA